MVDFRGSMEVQSGEITPEVPILQPVVDMSGAIMAEGLGNAFSALGGAVKKHRTNIAEASKTGVLNSYRQEAIRISNAVSQGQMDPSQANSAYRNLYSQYIGDNPSISADLDTLHAKLIAKGGIAAVSVEGSEQYKREKAFADEAYSKGFTTDGYRRQLNTTNVLKAKTDELALLKTDEERKEYIKSSGIKGTLQEFSLNALPVYERELDMAISAIDDGHDPMAVYDAVNSRFQKQKRELQAVTGEMDVDYLFKPFESLMTELKDYASGSTEKEIFQTRREAIQERNKFALMKDPAIATAVVKNDLFKGNIGVLAGLQAETLTAITELSGPGVDEGYKRSEAQTMDPDRQGMPSVLDDKNNPMHGPGIKRTVTELIKGANEDTTDLGKQRNALKLLDSTVQSVVDHSGRVSTPQQLNSVVDLLSDPEVADLISRSGGVSPATGEAAKEVISRQYSGPFLEAVTDIWDDGQFIETITIDQALKGEGSGESISEISVKDAVEPVWTGEGVRFQVKQEFADNKDVHKAKAAVERLNIGKNSVAQPLNKIIKAQALLEGTDDYKSIYERDYAERLVPVETTQAEVGEENFEEDIEDAIDGVGEVQAISPEDDPDIDIEDFSAPAYAPQAVTKKSAGITAIQDNFIAADENPDVDERVLSRFKGKRLPVSIRNNNMGAVSITGNIANSWAAKQAGFVGTSKRPKNEGGYYAKYATPEHGVGAASKLLENYGRRGINTPDKIVRKWSALKSAHNSYANTLVKYLQQAGIPASKSESLDLSDPKIRTAILKAKSAHESGAGIPVYSDKVFKAGASYNF